MAITDPILTPRLRLEPVTAGLRAAAERGPSNLADHIGAATPDEWVSTSYRVVLPRPSAGRKLVDIATERALVVHRTEKLIIGDVRFEEVDDGIVEIGYAILPAWRRKGFAVEAMTALIEELWEDGADLLIAGCDMKNVASIRTLRRLGFELDISRGRAFWWRLDKGD
jgi:[ribosomal protein S5]-alanine N-acetyltransferase